MILQLSRRNVANERDVRAMVGMLCSCFGCDECIYTGVWTCRIYWSVDHNLHAKARQVGRIVEGDYCALTVWLVFVVV